LQIQVATDVFKVGECQPAKLGTAVKKGVNNCYFCNDFLKCEKLDYQRETYRINENYERIKQVGYENWLKEQEKKSEANFDNIWFLEKRTSK
jgi:hypothetical protein